jgi:peptidoglycan/xylan/chitin deacetylase (PgdA/CDA1 family)
VKAAAKKQTFHSVGGPVRAGPDPLAFRRWTGPGYDHRVSLPGFYSSLPPFRALFAEGLPMLMYHKCGRPPRRARLRGLYMPPPIFDRQLDELCRHGFRSGSLDELPSSLAARDQVVLTFDDGYRSVLRRALPVLQKHGMTSINYLVPDLIGKSNVWDLAVGEVEEPLMTVDEVKQWLAAGQEIGAHTCTHPRLTRLPVDRAREEITASRKRLEDLFQRPVEHFCYPYGDWNPAVRDLVGEAGFRTATTVDFGVNKPGCGLLALTRITARYPSRNLKAWWRGLWGR